MSNNENILITGGTGLVGMNLTNRFINMGINPISIGYSKGEKQYDLRNQLEVKELFDYYSPDIVFHLAAKVGGIYANISQKSTFYIDNTLMNTNIIGEIQKRKISYVFAMGTGCAYPKRLEKKVLHEEDFLDGIPEITNDAYAYSKRNLLVHLKTCAEDHSMRYIYCIPSNLYGPYDNFHPKYSHVVPGLIIRILEAKKKDISKVKVWGTGKARRDFLYIDDLIDAMINLFENDSSNGSVNVASRNLTEISRLAEIICNVIDYKGEIEYDLSYPEGQKQRKFNIDKITSIGWSPTHTLEQGLTKTIEWCLNNPKLCI